MTRLVLGVSLMLNEIPPAVLAVFVHRMDRCAWHDQMAVLHLFRNVFNGVGEPQSHSPVLQRHVSMSELWSPMAPTADELNAALDGYVASTEVSAAFAATATSWPVYPRPEDVGEFPAYGSPMLMMHGSLDPTMPLERLDALREWYTAPEQHFVVIPDGGHVVLNEGDCARSIYRQFLSDPTTVPDTSCVSDVAPLDFAVSSETARLLFGTADLWGDQPSLMRSIFFFGLYRWGALVMGALGLFAVIVQLRRARGSRLSRVPVFLFWLGWCVLVLVVWQGLFFVPYVLPYLAMTTVAVAAGGLAIQGIAAWWLTRWLGRRVP